MQWFWSRRKILLAPHPNSLTSIAYLRLCHNSSVARVILFVSTPLCHKLSTSWLFVLTSTCIQSHYHYHCWCWGKLLLHIILMHCFYFKWNGFLHGLCVSVPCVKQKFLFVVFLLLDCFTTFMFPLSSWFICSVASLISILSMTMKWSTTQNSWNGLNGYLCTVSSLWVIANTKHCKTQQLYLRTTL